MITEATRGMISNAALLLTLGILYYLVPLRPRLRKMKRKTVLGVSIGLVGIALMLTRWQLLPGLFFDTRSVLLAVAGMFFGPLPTAIATAMLVVFRLSQGGVGAVTGVGVIVSSAAIGLLWRARFSHRRGWLDFYAVGLAVHIVMLGWMLVMPQRVAAETLRGIALPVIVIYPLATMLLAKLLDLQRYRQDAREEALHRERRLRRMLDRAWGIIHLLDEAGRSVFISESASRFLGYQPQELLGKRFDALVHPDERAEARSRFRELMARPDATINLELRLLHRDGHWVWFEHIATNLLGDPDVDAIVINSRDITERRKNEAAIKEQEERFRKVAESLEAIIWEFDLAADRWTYISPQVKRILGYEPEEFTDFQFWVERIHPEDRIWAPDYCVQESRLGRPHSFEYRFFDKDGRVVWLRDVVSVDMKQDEPFRLRGFMHDITARKSAQIALQESMEHYRRLLNNVNDAIYAHPINKDGTPGRFTEVNNMACQMLGYSREELLQLSPMEIDAPEGRERSVRVMETLRKEGEATFETVHLASDGTRIEVEINAHRFLDRGSPMIISIARDLSERRKVEEERHESEERLKAVGEHLDGVLYAVDTDLRFTVSKGKGLAALGFRPDQAVGMTMFEFLGTEDPNHPTIVAHERALKGEAVHYEQTHGPITFSSMISPIWNTRGEVIGAVGLAVDISRLKRAENALQENLAYQQSLLASAPVAIFTLSRDASVESWNRAAEEIFGWREEEVVGGPLPIVPAGKDDEYQEIFTRVIEGETIKDIVLSRQRKDGSEVILSLSATPLRDARGSIVGVQAAMMDITEKRRAEQAVRESESVLLQAQEVAKLGSWTYNLRDGVVTATEIAREIYGLEGEAWSIEEVQKATLPAYRPALDKALRNLVEGEKPYDEVFEIEHQGSGEVRSIHSVARYDETQHRIIGIIQDITEQVEAEKRNDQLEAELRQSQKMEAVGRLAGGVAHDFNNMLAVIMSATELALPEVDPEDQIYQDLLQIDRAAQRSAALTRQLLAFSRKQIINPQPLDLNRVVQEQEKMLSRLIGEDIAVSVKLESDLWPVFIDPTQVDQILANLAVNARDAIQGVGELTIETANAHLSSESSREDMPVEEGDYILLSVTDTGKGMDAETLERIFEPFFTTKEGGHGTGLGLATVYGIVRQNTGVIHVYSEPDMGTTFKVYLPRYQGRLEEQEASTVVGSTKGTETVLVVEDEESIIRLARRFLEREGYQVLTARSPNEAIGVVHEHKGPIHLLLSDVVMPGMNGKQLEEKLRGLRAGMKVLFMSGYTADVIAQRGVLDEGVEFVQKPFTMHTLTQRVRDILDRDEAR